MEIKKIFGITVWNDRKYRVFKMKVKKTLKVLSLPTLVAGLLLLALGYAGSMDLESCMKGVCP